MPFEKGRKKTGGRTKNTPNKKQAETRAKIQAIIDAVLPDALDMLRQVEDPAKRLELITKFLPYILPKTTELKVDSDEILKQITITVNRTADES